MNVNRTIILTCILLCVLCCSAPIGQVAQNQNSSPLTEVDFSVKGVELGSSYAQVLRRLGRPISSKREKILDETCGPAHTTLQLNYHGAVVHLVGDLKGRDFKVVEMEITSSLLIRPGVKTGMTESRTRAKLGTPWDVSDEGGYRILRYVTKGNDGGAQIYFRNDRLVKVNWAYTAC